MYQQEEAGTAQATHAKERPARLSIHAQGLLSVSTLQLLVDTHINRGQAFNFRNRMSTFLQQLQSLTVSFRRGHPSRTSLLSTFSHSLSHLESKSSDNHGSILHDVSRRMTHVTQGRHPKITTPRRTEFVSVSTSWWALAPEVGNLGTTVREAQGRKKQTSKQARRTNNISRNDYRVRCVGSRW